MLICLQLTRNKSFISIFNLLVIFVVRKYIVKINIIGDLFKKDLVEWTTAMTYQAASGAGVNHMKELLKQPKHSPI